MLVGITEAVEPSLWKVTRALKESVLLLDDMARHLADAGRPKDAERFFQKARVTEKRAHALRELTIKHPQLSQDALRDSIGETRMKPRESYKVLDRSTPITVEGSACRRRDTRRATP